VDNGGQHGEEVYAKGLHVRSPCEEWLKALELVAKARIAWIQLVLFL